jgi:hypothetical protein
MNGDLQFSWQSIKQMSLGESHTEVWEWGLAVFMIGSCVIFFVVMQKSAVKN